MTTRKARARATATATARARAEAEARVVEAGMAGMDRVSMPVLFLEALLGGTLGLDVSGG